MARHLRRLTVVAVVTAIVGAFSTAPAVAQGTPTCADVLGSGIVNHGQHVLDDYVTGLGAVLPGSGELQWPPAGQVGTAVQDNGGAFLPGGAGPNLHFSILGLPPGASFCLDQAHPNGFDVPDHFQ
jgi:hypothetical protein